MENPDRDIILSLNFMNEKNLIKKKKKYIKGDQSSFSIDINHR